MLSNFDEYISYARDPRDFERSADSLEEILRHGGLLLVDGSLAGRWKRTVRASSVDVEVECRPAMTGPVLRAIEAEAEAFGTFLGRHPRLMITD